MSKGLGLQCSGLLCTLAEENRGSTLAGGSVPVGLGHKVIMYNVEAKATSHLITVGHLSFDLYRWST
jgi:hypothetical protein